MPALNETKIAEIIEQTETDAKKDEPRQQKPDPDKEPRLRANVDQSPEETPS